MKNSIIELLAYIANKSIIMALIIVLAVLSIVWQSVNTGGHTPEETLFISGRWNLIIYERRREFALHLLQGESTACLSRLVIRADGEFL